MGAWGYGIRQDDLVCDIVGDFDDRLKAGNSVDLASKAIIDRYTGEMSDTDESHLIWIAIADRQWTYGQLDQAILVRVKNDLASEKSLTEWDDDPKGKSKRKSALEKFIGKIETANPRPKKPPKIVVRKPLFAAGDCLSIQLPNGMYGAALVLVADHSDIEYGKNLLAMLDYMSSEKASLETFRQRKWLVLSHHSWKNKMDISWYTRLGYRSVQDRVEVVGNIEIIETDPTTSHTYAGWGNHLGEQVIKQKEWDQNTSNT